MHTADMSLESAMQDAARELDQAYAQLNYAADITAIDAAIRRIAAAEALADHIRAQGLRTK